MATRTLWFLLKGKKKPMDVTLQVDASVAKLQRAVRDEYANSLVGVDPGDLMIYLKHGDEEALDPMDPVPEHEKGTNGKPIPFYVDYPDVEPAEKRQRTDVEQKSRLLLESILPATVSEDKWLTVHARDPIYVRPCYKNMASMLMDSKSLAHCERLTYVVKGTPGIGKTTMLYYLLWRCTRDDSPFTAVLFADAEGAFVARKSGAEWHSEPFDGDGMVAGEADKAIGLLDATPEGTVEVRRQVVVKVNQQGPCRVYGLHRLVVAASAGANLGQLIDKDRDGLGPKVLYLPVWLPETTRLWARTVLTCGDDVLDNAEPVIGLAIPRLVGFLVKSGEKYINQVIQRFIDVVAGKSVADVHSSAKDAHRMVLLQGSQELMETEEDSGELASPGSVIGFASDKVAKEVASLVFKGESFKNVLRIVPKAASYVFEEMVLTQMVTADGLTFNNQNCLKFSEESELRAMKGPMKPGVLYRCRRGADYPSIDGCGFQIKDDTLFLMQIATGRVHMRVQRNLVQNIAVPQACTSVQILYMVPTSPSSLTLVNGRDPLKSGSQKSNKPVNEMIVAASSVLVGLPADLRATFEPGC